MDAQLLLVFAIISVGGLDGVAAQTHGVQGPVFLQEPPSSLTFSNTSGSQVSCSAHGSPTPQVEWLLQDGNVVTAVPGLRQSLGNGTLYFPPFRAQDYRKDVHFTVYRCRASNLVGTILSRDVNVKAVIRQHYEVQVYRAHVLAGNTAVLSCVIPSYVKEHVTVTSWFRDDSILLPGRADMGGRYVVISGSGDLHIRSARSDDGLARYSCLTLHSLTQERKRSAPAMLTVTEATGSMPPRLAPRTLTAVGAEHGADVHLSCSAQGNPPPSFTWYREKEGMLEAVVPSVRITPSQDILYIKRVEPEDSGRWSCKASNQFGEQILDIHLTVTAHLNVHVIPQLQVVNSGESATFNCTVTGSPIGSVQWYRNGEPLSSGNQQVVTDIGRVRLLGPMTLTVTSVTRHDRGMYQCGVKNDRESAQASAELRLGDTVPELQYTFIEQALRPGPQVSLRCSATGSPPPQFKWTLDGQPLSEMTAGHSKKPNHTKGSVFKVYWNSPTFQCPKEMKFADLLKKFGILHNERGAFRGSKIAIFYDPGCFPIMFQKPNDTRLFARNGGIPQNGNLSLHLERIKIDIEYLLPEKNFSGVGVIDFEYWRPLYYENFGKLSIYKNASIRFEKKLRPTLLRSKIITKARLNFEKSARIFMEETLKLVKLLRPNAKWGYYGYPFCYNMRFRSRVNCTVSAKKQNEKKFWLFSQSDGFYPSIYMKNSTMNRTQKILLVKLRLSEAKRLQQRFHPNKSSAVVLPYYWYKYRDIDEYFDKDDLYRTINAVKQNGAHGIILWGSTGDVNTTEKCLKLHHYIRKTLGPVVKNIMKSGNKDHKTKVD